MEVPGADAYREINLLSIFWGNVNRMAQGEPESVRVCVCVECMLACAPHRSLCLQPVVPRRLWNSSTRTGMRRETPGTDALRRDLLYTTPRAVAARIEPEEEQEEEAAPVAAAVTDAASSPWGRAGAPQWAALSPASPQ